MKQMLNESPKKRSNFKLGYGSAWHLLRLLGYHRNSFSHAIVSQLKADEIIWSDFVPCVQEDVYVGNAPIRERELVRLEFLPIDHPLQKEYAKIWPETRKLEAQQNWDAVAKVRFGDCWEWLLVEAKANVQELESSCQATWPPNRSAIEDSLNKTKIRLKVDVSSDWMNTYYQYANRLVTLDFLNSNEQPARLVFIYFCGDVGSPGRSCPNSRQGWEQHIEHMKVSLGLSSCKEELLERVHTVFFDLDCRDIFAEPSIS